MAVSKLWPVTVRLKAVLDYAANPEKTFNPNYTLEQYQALRDVLAYAKDGRSRKAPFCCAFLPFPCRKGETCMQLSIRDLTFAYPGGEPVFEHLNLNLDTGWRLGVIGRNGRGKTTLLRLMMGCMSFEGAIDLPLEAAYFP